LVHTIRADEEKIFKNRSEKTSFISKLNDRIRCFSSEVPFLNYSVRLFYLGTRAERKENYGNKRLAEKMGFRRLYRTNSTNLSGN
jgi:hypothetical protein